MIFPLFRKSTRSKRKPKYRVASDYSFRGNICVYPTLFSYIFKLLFDDIFSRQTALWKMETDIFSVSKTFFLWCFRKRATNSDISRSIINTNWVRCKEVKIQNQCKQETRSKCEMSKIATRKSIQRFHFIEYFLS